MAFFTLIWAISFLAEPAAKVLFKALWEGIDETAAAWFDVCISSSISLRKIDIDLGADIPILTESPSILVMDISI